MSVQHESRAKGMTQKNIYSFWTEITLHAPATPPRDPRSLLTSKGGGVGEVLPYIALWGMYLRTWHSVLPPKTGYIISFESVNCLHVWFGLLDKFCFVFTPSILYQSNDYNWHEWMACILSFVLNMVIEFRVLSLNRVYIFGNLLF